MSLPPPPQVPPPPLPPPPLWAMIASIAVAAIAGLVAGFSTGILSCRHHTVDACIPLVEVGFGVAVCFVTLAWLVAAGPRRRSIRSGLFLATSGTVAFSGIMATVGPVLCPATESDGVICSLSLPLGVAGFVVVAAACWRLQRPIGETDDGLSGAGRPSR